MLRTLAASMVCLLLGACGQLDRNLEQSAQAEVETVADQQKEQIEAAAKEAQRQVKEAAEAEEKWIKAEAKAAKAAIEAEKAQAVAALKTEQRNVEEQSSRIQEAVGSAQEAISGKRDSDTQVLEPAPQQTPPAQAAHPTHLACAEHPAHAAHAGHGVQVNVENGVVTLTESARSEQGQKELEKRVETMEGRCTCRWLQDVNTGFEVQGKQ